MPRSTYPLVALVALLVTSSVQASPNIAVVRLKEGAQWTVPAVAGTKLVSHRAKAGDVMPPTATLFIEPKASVTIRWVDGIDKDGLIVATATCKSKSALVLSLSSTADIKSGCPDVAYSLVALELAGGNNRDTLARVMAGGSKIRLEGHCMDEAIKELPRYARTLFEGTPRATVLADVTIARLAYLGRFEAAAGVGRLCGRPGTDNLVAAGIIAAPAQVVASTLADCTVAVELACLASPPKVTP